MSMAETVADAHAVDSVEEQHAGLHISKPVEAENEVVLVEVENGT